MAYTPLTPWMKFVSYFMQKYRTRKQEFGMADIAFSEPVIYWRRSAQLKFVAFI